MGKNLSCMSMTAQIIKSVRFLWGQNVRYRFQKSQPLKSTPNYNSFDPHILAI
jgi:hypothetical protein